MNCALLIAIASLSALAGYVVSLHMHQKYPGADSIDWEKEVMRPWNKEPVELDENGNAKWPGT